VTYLDVREISLREVEVQGSCMSAVPTALRRTPEVGYSPMFDPALTYICIYLCISGYKNVRRTGCRDACPVGGPYASDQRYVLRSRRRFLRADSQRLFWPRLDYTRGWLP